MRIPTLAELELGALLVGGVILAIVAAKAIGKLKIAADAGAFNPGSSANVVYVAAGAVVSSVTEGAEETVGGLAARVREALSGDAARIRAMQRVEPPVSSYPLPGIDVDPNNMGTWGGA